MIWEVIDGKFFPDRNRAQYFNQDEQPKRRGKSFVNPEGSSGLAHSDGDQAMFIDDGEELAVRLSEHDWEMVHALSSESREVVDEYPDELQADEVEPATGSQLGVEVEHESDGSPESVSDTDTSSSQDSDSSVDEQVVAKAALNLGEEGGEALGDFWTHKRLGTLHREVDWLNKKLACGRWISAAYVRAPTQRFSWTRCAICFPKSS